MARLKKKKKLMLVFCCCTVFLVIIHCRGCKGVEEARAVSASGVTNWGLRFSEEGKTPQINMDGEKLKELNGFYLGDDRKKNIYLTFDAGYENGHTEKILDALKKHGVKATFFLVGNYLETCPDLVKRMVEEGHMVGNHTDKHKDMATIMSEEAFLEELTNLEKKFTEITGKELDRFYRPPQGKFIEEHLLWAKDQGYKTIFWSLAYVDWNEGDQPSLEEAIDLLTRRIHPGAIVLLHNTSETNGKIMDDLLTKWKEMGYSFSTLNEL